MDNVFNELSLSGWCEHHEAEVGLEHLCSLLLALAERGCAPVLRTPKSFWSQALYDGYTVGQWLRIAGGGKRRDNARLVASWASKSPFIDDLLRKAEGQRGAIEGRCSGALALVSVSDLFEGRSLLFEHARRGTGPLAPREP